MEKYRLSANPHATPGKPFGHEPVGVVTEVAPGVTNLKVCNRVSGLFSGSAEYAAAATINLLSPDVLLFSGGLSEQRSYRSSVIAHARGACYSSVRLPRMEKAGLGELAPLIGAALSDLSRKRKDV